MSISFDSSNAYISATEAMQVLGVNRSRIAQMCRSGELEAEKFGGVWAIKASSVKHRLDNPPKVGRKPGNAPYGRVDVF